MSISDSPNSSADGSVPFARIARMNSAPVGTRRSFANFVFAVDLEMFSFTC
jgi:hypothetical protein